MWQEAVLKKSIETGTGRFNVATTKLEEYGTVPVRCAPWAESEQVADGNDGTYFQRTFLTPAPTSALEGVTYIGVGGVDYRIDRVSRQLGKTLVTGRSGKLCPESA